MHPLNCVPMLLRCRSSSMSVQSSVLAVPVLYSASTELPATTAASPASSWKACGSGAATSAEKLKEKLFGLESFTRHSQSPSSSPCRSVAPCNPSSCSNAYGYCCTTKKTDPFFKIFTIFTPYTAKGNSRNITRRKGFITNGNGYDSR